MNAEYTGKKIAELRKEKKLTQRELANKLHITDKAVSKWERGINFPDLGLMEELATALDTTPSILLGLEEATKEEIVTSFAEISSRQSEDAAKDIQKIGWINLFAGIFLVIFLYFINVKLQRNGLFFESQALLWFIYGLITVIMIGAIYILRKYKAIKKWETLDVVLTEVIVIDAVVFLAIQLFTGTNPDYMVSSILIGLASVGVQLLFYRVMKPQWMKALPMMGTFCWTCWVILLRLSQAQWINLNIWNLIIYGILPVVCCSLIWWILRKKDAEKERMIPVVKVFAVVFLIVTTFIFLFGQDLLAKLYLKAFHNQLEAYAEELLENCEDTTSDRYGIWKVICYPEDDLVEFYTSGTELVSDSAYEGFYFSPDNTHKTFQGTDIPLNVNDNLADWYGEGDNWGKSMRLIENWFWFEANF